MQKACVTDYEPLIETCGVTKQFGSVQALKGLNLQRARILIPCLTVVSVASASIFEIRLFLRTAAKTRISALMNDLEKLIVGALAVLAPIALYSLTFVLFFNHALSLLTMGSITFSELALAIYLLKRS